MNIFKKYLVFCALYSILGKSEGFASSPIFSVNTQCQYVAGGSKGDHYTSPCSTSGLSFSSSTPTPLPEGSSLRKLRFLDHIEVAFACKSLRPIKVSWAFDSNAGELAPGDSFKVDLPSGYDGKPWFFTPQLGSSGIQAFYPNCGATVVSHFLYPDPLAFKVIGNLLERVDKSLGLIFDQVTASSDSLATLTAIEDGLNILEILELTAASEDFVNQQFARLETQLLEAQSRLTQACEAGSEVKLCTVEIALARSLIDSQRNGLKLEYLDMKDYLKAEILRLGSSEDPGTAEVMALLTKSMSQLK